LAIKDVEVCCFIHNRGRKKRNIIVCLLLLDLWDDGSTKLSLLKIHTENATDMLTKVLTTEKLELCKDIVEMNVR